MKYWTLLAAAALAVPTAAYACSCVASDDPVELRQYAADTAKSALALVEAETLIAYQQGGPGESMRVVRTLAGNAPAQFRIERGPFPSSATCDVLYEKGQKALIVLYGPSAQTPGTYRTSGLCTGMMLEKPAFRDELIRHLSAKSTAERG
jgi:hypothetical protein